MFLLTRTSVHYLHVTQAKQEPAYGTPTLFNLIITSKGWHTSPSPGVEFQDISAGFNVSRFAPNGWSTSGLALRPAALQAQPEDHNGEEEQKDPESLCSA